MSNNSNVLYDVLLGIFNADAEIVEKNMAVNTYEIIFNAVRLR